MPFPSSIPHETKGGTHNEKKDHGTETQQFLGPFLGYLPQRKKKAKKGG